MAGSIEGKPTGEPLQPSGLPIPPKKPQVIGEDSKLQIKVLLSLIKKSIAITPSKAMPLPLPDQKENFDVANIKNLVASVRGSFGQPNKLAALEFLSENTVDAWLPDMCQQLLLEESPVNEGCWKFLADRAGISPEQVKALAKDGAKDGNYSELAGLLSSVPEFVIQAIIGKQG